MNRYFFKGGTQMANIHLKRESTSSVIKEGQLEATVRSHSHGCSHCKLTLEDCSKFRPGCRKLLVATWKVQLLWGQFGSFSKKFTFSLLLVRQQFYFQSIQLKDLLIVTQTDICKATFIVALVTVSKRCPAVGEGNHRMWHIEMGHTPPCDIVHHDREWHRLHGWTQGLYAKWNKPGSKGQMVSVSSYLRYLE